MPSRYVQWSCTTPTMLFTLAKISDFSERRVALVMFCDWMMILTGYIAALYPPGFVSCECQVHCNGCWPSTAWLPWPLCSHMGSF